MSELQDVLKKLIKFRDKRDWAQFHDTKNLAVAISIEAAELNELFLWKNTTDSEAVDDERIKEELADVLIFSFLLAKKHDFNIADIMLEKIKKNEMKYPVSKSKGKSTKYTALD